MTRTARPDIEPGVYEDETGTLYLRGRDGAPDARLETVVLMARHYVTQGYAAACRLRERGCYTDEEWQRYEDGLPLARAVIDKYDTLLPPAKEAPHG